MARRKAAPKHEKPEDAGEQDASGQEGGMSKVEAVRRALAAAFDGPQEGTAYIDSVHDVVGATGPRSARTLLWSP